jgi:hypothetical protein
MSTDRDFYQLASDSVSVLNTRRRPGGKVIGPEHIRDKFGVEPDQWADYRALTGDPSDNIRGVRGVGPVTAKRLLSGGIGLGDMERLGRLMAMLRQRGTRVVGLDGSPTQLSQASGPGGLFAACSPSRHDDPELVEALPEYAATFEMMSFDSESGPGLVEGVFGNVEVEPWDGPYTRLPDRDAVELYLYGHGLPRVQVSAAASRVPTPLTITKRGAVIYAYKPPKTSTAEIAEAAEE